MIRNRITQVTKRLKNGKVLVSVAIAALIALIVGIGIYNMPANRLQRQSELANKHLEELNYEKADMESDNQTDLGTETEDSFQDNIVEEEAEGDPITLMYQKYYDKLLELQNQYGLCEDVTEDMDDPFLEENCYLKGLCFAKLIDFDANGTEEMILAYNAGATSEDVFFQDYIVEIWAYQESAIHKVYSDKPMNEGEGALGIYLTLFEGKYYLYNYMEEFDDETYEARYIDEWRGFNGEIVDILKRNVCKTVYSETGEIETYSIDDREVTKAEWTGDRDRWTNLVEDYGLQNGGNTLDASVGELTATFKTLSERLGIEWVDNISREKEEKPYSDSVWGTELIGYWETLRAESLADWATLTFYEDGLAELHTRSGVCFGSFEIQSDGCVMINLNDEYLYDNSVAQWFHAENNMQIRLTMGSNVYEMNYAYVSGMGEGSFPESAVLTRVAEEGADYSSAEEAMQYYKSVVSR